MRIKGEDSAKLNMKARTYNKIKRVESVSEEE